MRTPIWFYKKTTTYVSGAGATETWTQIYSDPLLCDWTSAYGERAVQASAAGVNDSATVKTYFDPTVYSAMKTQRVIVVRDSTASALSGGIPDANNPNVYELWGVPENVKEQNRDMYFRVRRFEGI